MNPNLMRRIDFWVGVPLCFFLTLWYKLQCLFGLKDPCYSEPPKNVLFIELAEMGSTVLAYPALRTLKELYPEAVIHFLVFKQNAATADIIDLIPHENVITIDSSGLLFFFRDTLWVMKECRRRKIDTVINLEMFARYSTLTSYLVGAQKRVGFHRFYQEGLYTGDFLTHKVPYNSHIHTAHSFIALVRSLAEPQTDIPLGKFPVDDSKLVLPKIASTPGEKEKVWGLLRALAPDISEQNQLVLLNPNASKLIEQRKWPLENYAELARKILDGDGNVYVVITGSDSEYEEGERIRALVKSEHIINAAGKTSLWELIHLFNIARVLVTNDSGPAHFASLTNIHIVVFFGPETPRLYKPISENCTVLYTRFSCSPCVSAFNQRRTPCNANMCLRDIEVEGVYGKVKEILIKYT